MNKKIGIMIAHVNHSHLNSIIFREINLKSDSKAWFHEIFVQILITQCGNFMIFPPFAKIFRQIIFKFFTKSPLQKDVSTTIG